MSKSKKSPAKKSAKLDHAAIVKRLTSGESTLIEESKRAGLVPNTPLRNQLREYLGGKAQYSAMIKRSEPLPRIPPELERDQLELVVPLQFSLR